MRLKALALTAAALAAAASPAAAKLYVLGDVSVLTDTPATTINATFLESLVPAHGSIVIDGPNSTMLARFYNAAGDKAHRVTTGTGITPALLAGAGLFIDMTPTTAFTAAEVKTLSNFLHSGGSVLLAGDSSQRWVSNGYINTLLTDLRSGIQIQNSYYSWSGSTAVSSTTRPAGRLQALSAVTGGLHYRSASTVQGGSSLYSIPGAGSLLTSVSLVPEPAEWATVFAGFAVLGLASRRRRGWRQVSA